MLAIGAVTSPPCTRARWARSTSDAGQVEPPLVVSDSADLLLPVLNRGWHCTYGAG